MVCKIERDDHGTTYTIPEAAFAKRPRGPVLRGSPAVEVWWNARSDERMIIRQEFIDRDTADVIELTQAQVYDLIYALNHSLGIPIKDYLSGK